MHDSLTPHVKDVKNKKEVTAVKDKEVPAKDDFEFSEDEKKEFKLLNESLLKEKLQLADVQVQIELLTQQKSLVFQRLANADKKVTDRVQLALQTRGHSMENTEYSWYLDTDTMVCRKVPRNR